MAENTAIEWCDDSISFWWGCEKIAPGCKFCYAETLSKRFGKYWGGKEPRLYIASAAENLQRLNRKAQREGKPRIVFVNSMSDFFEYHDGPIVDRKGQRMAGCHGRAGYHPLTEESFGRSADTYWLTLGHLRRDAFRVFGQCSWLQFLLLTKRPENVLRIWPRVSDGTPSGEYDERYLENVWLGASVSDQATADAMIPELLKCRDLCPVLFLSCEPLLGPVNLFSVGSPQWDVLHGWKLGHRGYPEGCNTGRIDWIIVGSESGPRRRPMQFDWAKSIYDQCRRSGVAFFMKQAEIGGKVTGQMDQFPNDLQTREYPNAKY